jgi:hypothetical protein
MTKLSDSEEFDGWYRRDARANEPIVDREEIQQKIEKLAQQLKAQKAKTAFLRSPRRNLRGPSVQRVVIDEGESFPEHEHAWTVVQIDNNPVGVSCQFCDVIRELAPEVGKPDKVPSQDELPPSLDLRIGASYIVQVGHGGTYAHVRDVRYRTDQTISVELVTDLP